MNRHILFVTYQDEEIKDGLSYAIDLAKAMNEGITILLVRKKNLLARLSDAMTAVAFAEAGEHGTAREILVGSNDESRGKIGLLFEKCQAAGVTVDVHDVKSDAVSAVNDFLKQKNGVDMVLLDPSVTDNGDVTARELQRLVRTASRPVVTMARHAFVT